MCYHVVFCLIYLSFCANLFQEAMKAVKRCKKAGIAVRMITGDHPTTALAIAHQLGIVDDMDPRNVLKGQEV